MGDKPMTGEDRDTQSQAIDIHLARVEVILQQMGHSLSRLRYAKIQRKMGHFYGWPKTLMSNGAKTMECAMRLTGASRLKNDRFLRHHSALTPPHVRPSWKGLGC